MKKRIPIIIFAAIFLVGLLMLVYPLAGEWMNRREQAQIVAAYSERVEALQAAEYETLLTRAREYNQSHKINDFSISDTDADTAEYREQLSLEGISLIGYLIIDSLDIRIGIYHGVDDAALLTGVGHLPQTSLPVGGADTHAVISGHTGLPSAELLSTLDSLVIGDTFQLVVLGEAMSYRVDQILTVEPDDISQLRIIPGRDLVTVMTCTPYGVNSHRLLVRGTAFDPEAEREPEALSDAVPVDPFITAAVYTVAVFAAAAIVALAVRLSGRRKKRR